MERYTNSAGKPCYRGVTEETEFSAELFHEVAPWLDQIQFALHTDIGSITVVDRMTGFGWRDIETGFRDQHGEFWLASGGLDVRDSGCKTFGEAIRWVKGNANNCIGKEQD